MSWEQRALLLCLVVISLAGLVELVGWLRRWRRPKLRRLWLDKFDRRNNP